MPNWRLVEVREPYTRQEAIRIWLSWLVRYPNYKVTLRNKRVERREKFYAV